MFNERKIYDSIAAVTMVLLLLFCSSCNKNEPSGQADAYLEPDSQAYAYLEVFKDLAEDIAEKKIKYISVNLMNVLHEHPIYIQKLIEDYAREYGVQILWSDKKNSSISSENS